ncbi:unnamed protein product [Cuscuta epithymum]|uniref:Uncharacterized protein n=1 Tax=Cuscuta epithymum TaxID=186058 RepID=A0AAV0DNM1_9ASTE|nr:unnamed protein product [Cuscuta epithymum]
MIKIQGQVAKIRRRFYIGLIGYLPYGLFLGLFNHKKREIQLQNDRTKEDEAAGMVADAGGNAPISVGLVRVLRHLGSSSRRLLENHNERSSWEDVWSVDIVDLHTLLSLCF